MRAPIAPTQRTESRQRPLDELQLVARLDPGRGAGRELDRHLRAAGGSRSPGPQAADDLDDPQIPVAEDGVDRKPHEKHVDRPGGTEEDPFVRRERGAPHQAAELRPERLRQLAPGADDRAVSRTPHRLYHLRTSPLVVIFTRPAKELRRRCDLSPHQHEVSCRSEGRCVAPHDRTQVDRRGRPDDGRVQPDPRARPSRRRPRVRTARGHGRRFVRPDRLFLHLSRNDYFRSSFTCSSSQFSGSRTTSSAKTARQWPSTASSSRSSPSSWPWSWSPSAPRSRARSTRLSARSKELTSAAAGPPSPSPQPLSDRTCIAAAATVFAPSTARPPSNSRWSCPCC